MIFSLPCACPSWGLGAKWEEGPSGHVIVSQAAEARHGAGAGEAGDAGRAGPQGGAGAAQQGQGAQRGRSWPEVNPAAEAGLGLPVRHGFFSENVAQKYLSQAMFG